MIAQVPSSRIQAANERPVEAAGRFVLYWMTSARRANWNFALQRALGWALDLKKPLLVVEAVGCRYRWASDRFHRFILEGMIANGKRFSRSAVSYYPYVERQEGEGKGLLAALAKQACLVVGDHYPVEFHPRMARAAARQSTVLMELVDSNGLLPLAAAGRAFDTAFAFRRFLQKHLADFLKELPAAAPLQVKGLEPLDGMPAGIRRRWPQFERKELSKLLSVLPIDHGVGAVSQVGGSAVAQRQLEHFLEHHLEDYPEMSRQPEAEGTSRLSPYLHFGHISAHQVFAELMSRQQWNPHRLPSEARGRRRGWWGVGEGAEAFLDQLVTWRELGFNACTFLQDYDRYDSLPEWARKTLAEHERDEREHLYAPDQFEAAATHDPLWNAAQNQLVGEGHVHGYLRMLWGKKILEWSPSPGAALEVMIELNNKYALDGRDPNSYSGIFWVLGRYDRAWGPERPVFGKIRYMSSQNTARKLRVKEYVSRYGQPPD